MKHDVKISTQRATTLSLLLALWASGTVAAAGADAAYQDLHSIQQQAVAFVEQHADSFSVPPEVVAGDLDSRLRLAQCERPLQAFASPGGLRPGHGVVGVRCDGERPWKIYAPVDISLPAEVVVLARAMRRGEIIAAADLTTREADLARLRGQHYRDPADLVGHRVRRSLAANQVVSPAMVDARRLVQRGAVVTIVATTAAIEVRMSGKALGQGGRGDRIRVKNSRSGRVITATVMDRNLVRASL